ncbi:MAG TPA: RNA polymerase sigma factor [Steroidobacteraceae bacterium]|nr:RNA polymerase sigma factor [Steroidobacteraceae bacterium]
MRTWMGGYTYLMSLDSTPVQGDAVSAPGVRSASQLSDADLAARAAKGEHAAFDQIMRRYNQRLFRLAVSIMKDAAEAEDVLQESYVRAFYRLSSMSGSNLGAWLARIVRNEAIDRLRARESRQTHIALEADLDYDTDDGMTMIDNSEASDSHRSDPQVTTEAAQMQSLLEQAITQLPDAFRTVFVLREVEGMSVEETSEYLGIPAATVKTRDHRARNLLRTYISESVRTTLPATFPFMGERCDRVVATVLSRLRQAPSP